MNPQNQTKPQNRHLFGAVGRVAVPTYAGLLAGALYAILERFV
jgi:hypothetical protein